jgi:hypothetical protein
MTFDLKAELPRLMPHAVAWAERQEAHILSGGVTLGPVGVEIARGVGVSDPSAVRVLIVDPIPSPDDPALIEANEQVPLVGPHLAGLTFGHGIFMRKDHAENLLTLAHELRHVHQYEGFGSIPAFLSVYLPQVAEHGYTNAPLELEAQEAAERLFRAG